MAGLEVLTGNEKLNILQCQKLAMDIGFDSCEFDLCGPKGRLRCQWLDAYFGMFCIKGESNFIMVRQFQYQPDVWCENVTPRTAEAEEPPVKSPNSAKPKPRKRSKGA
jgi:hypothetical protein